MKKLIVLVSLLFVTAGAVRAETVKTCSTVYGGGEVCGETTTTVTVEHKTVNAGIMDYELWQVVAGVLGIAVLASVLYKLSYRWYILG